MTTKPKLTKEERRVMQREAIDALKEAADAFDQACSLLEETGMYKRGVQLPNSGFRFDAQDLNMKLIPALIKQLELDITDYEEED